MDEQGIKKLLCKKPIVRLLLITFFLGLLLLYITDEKDYYISLVCPVTVTSDKEGDAFLKDQRHIVGNLKEVPLYYSGYDMHVESYAEDGERWRDEKVESIYLCHIDNKIVICEYADASKRPKEILHGRRLLCYVEQLAKDPELYNLQGDIVKETMNTEKTINAADFSSRVIKVMPIDQVLYEMVKEIIVLLITLIVLKHWLKNLQRTISIRLCRGIRWAIRAYGPLSQIYRKIAQEENMILSDEIILTKSWLIHNGAKEIIYCDDIVWVYHKMRRLPLDSSYTYIYTKDGRKHRIFNWNSRDIFTVYDRIKEQRPWIVEGYSKEKRQALKINSIHFMKCYSKAE